MSTTTIEQNIIYGIGEGALVADATMLAYALRWANNAYREIFTRYRFKHINLRTIFRTTLGQQTYQAPSGFMGFLVMKDETNSQIIDQVTPEEFTRSISTTLVTNETTTSSFDVAVALDNQALVQYSETVQNTDEDTTYTRDTDYAMAYPAGTITVDSTGSMSDATDYYIDYAYYTQGKPTKFCLEYDVSNTVYVFRLDPTPDAEYVVSLLFPSDPAALSGSVEPLWAKLEFALERGGIYYGSLELIDDVQKRAEFKMIYESAMQGLIQLDQELVPKHDQIKVVMRKVDY